MPIAPGKKGPRGRHCFAWNEIHTEWRIALLNQQIDQNLFRRHGAGLLLGVGRRAARHKYDRYEGELKAYALDFDIYGEMPAAYIRAAVLHDFPEFKYGCWKVGQAPKSTLLVASYDRMAKKFSDDFKTPGRWNINETRRTRCEFLGFGQQTVVAGIHPDTRKPYWYMDPAVTPLTLPLEEWPRADEQKIDDVLELVNETCRYLGLEPFAAGKPAEQLLVKRDMKKRSNRTAEQKRSNFEIPNEVVARAKKMIAELGEGKMNSGDQVVALHTGMEPEGREAVLRRIAPLNIPLDTVMAPHPNKKYEWTLNDLVDCKAAVPRMRDGSDWMCHNIMISGMANGSGQGVATEMKAAARALFPDCGAFDKIWAAPLKRISLGTCKYIARMFGVEKADPVGDWIKANTTCWNTDTDWISGPALLEKLRADGAPCRNTVELGVRLRQCYPNIKKRTRRQADGRRIAWYALRTGKAAATPPSHTQYATCAPPPESAESGPEIRNSYRSVLSKIQFPTDPDPPPADSALNFRLNKANFAQETGKQMTGKQQPDGRHFATEDEIAIMEIIERHRRENPRPERPARGRRPDEPERGLLLHNTMEVTL